MATKRDNSAITISDEERSPSQSSNKRQRNQGHSRKSKPSEPATDLTYGQRQCFPGLDETTVTSDEDLDIEDEQDALAYLNSVRQEASGIPHLLVAPKSGPQLPAHIPASNEIDYEDEDSGLGGFNHSIYEDGIGDQRGYYYDGAYTAAPAKNESASDEYTASYEDDSANEEQRKADKIAQAYFNCLVAHFTSLRECLHQDPPVESVRALTKEQSPFVGKFGPKSRTFTIWTKRLRHVDPRPAQVASMDKGSIFRLIRIILGDKFLRKGTDLRERTSRWLWALLARLPDRGELDSTDIANIRELGKRAALLMHTLQEMAALREEVELGIHDEDGEEDEVWDGEVIPSSEIVERDDDSGTDEATAPASPEQVSGPVIANSNVPGSPHGNRDEELEDGEVPDDSIPVDIDADIETAKARLLAQLNDPSCPAEPKPETIRVEPEIDGNDEEVYDPVRARMNMRATLNMILTVASEFYGQTDLLEFRAPFNGI